MNDTRVKLLSIGVAESKIAGRCAGADKDAKEMFEEVSSLVSPVYSRLLISEEATAANVSREMAAVCSDTDLAVIFYAGHGGSQKIKYNAPEELDGKDEYILLHDTYMLDDQIWNIVSKAECRVFFIFDCCHSETMFRFAGNIVNIAEKNQIKKFLKNIWYKLVSIFSPQNSIFAGWKSKREAKKREAILLNQQPAFSELLCWSACADDKVSLGNSSGGLFTLTLLSYLEHCCALTYEAFWNKVSVDARLASRETCKSTLLVGTGKDTFKDRSVFT